ncbi:hypothetical protein GCM10027185_61630 [Spirosoma pulveris]
MFKDSKVGKGAKVFIVYTMGKGHIDGKVDKVQTTAKVAKVFTVTVVCIERL